MKENKVNELVLIGGDFNVFPKPSGLVPNYESFEEVSIRNLKDSDPKYLERILSQKRYYILIPEEISGNNTDLLIDLINLAPFHEGYLEYVTYRDAFYDEKEKKWKPTDVYYNKSTTGTWLLRPDILFYF